MRRVYALVALVDGDNNYLPGNEITKGALYEQADYYAGIGKVRIVAEQTQDEADTQDRQTLEEYTVAELQEMARERGVSYSGLRKAELIEALQ